MSTQNVPRPLYDLIIIRPAEKLERSSSGLWLPEPVAEDVGTRVEKGTVVRVGQGRRHPRTGILFPPDVRAGDVVLYNKALKLVEGGLGEDGLTIVAESDILAIVHD